MKTLILVLALIALNANTMFAQTRQQLRDSLSAASEALSFYPDSLNLRLRKASWNVQLEEWQYARDEYDYVLRRDPNNLAALFYRAGCSAIDYKPVATP